MADDKKREELVEIDISNLNIEEGPEQELDLTQDAWERSAPPRDDRRYKVKVFPSKKFSEGGKVEGVPFFTANLELKIVGDSDGTEDYTDGIVFGKVSSYIRKGKDISTMAGLLLKMGVTPPGKITGLALVRLLFQALKQEPQLWIDGNWAAWDMKKEEWIKQGMKNFPKLENGNHNHVIANSGGEDVNAKYRVTKFFSLKEYAELVKNAKGKAGTAKAGAASNKVTVAVDDKELVLD